MKFFDNEEIRITRALSDLEFDADVERRYLQAQLSACELEVQKWEREHHRTDTEWEKELEKRNSLPTASGSKQ